MRRAPDFWWQKGSLKAAAFWPAAALYRVVADRRLRGPSRYQAPVPVLCVGNLVAGGAGKTPTVLAMVDAARRTGREPVALARGYGGRHHGPLTVDLDHHDAADVGDEPVLLAAAVPTVIARDRTAAARHAVEELAPDLLIVDDNFQNPALAKDYTILVVDGEQGIGNGMCLPAGPLRASLRAQVMAAQMVLVIGDGDKAEPAIRAAARQGKPVRFAVMEPAEQQALAGQSVLAFAGIGRPEKFFNSLQEIGVDVVEHRSFPDHHPYSALEAHDLMRFAAEQDLHLVTTTKDMARMRASQIDAVERLALRTETLEISIAFQDVDTPKWIIEKVFAAFAARK